MLKVVLGVPSGDTVHANFAMSLARLCLFSERNTRIRIQAIINAKSSIVQKGRHETIAQALEVDASHILFLDSDMTFPEDILQVLLSHKKDIVGCNYSTRSMPYKQTARNINGEYFPERIQTLEEVGYIGTGCLLVNLDVFRKLGTPYFDVKWDGKKFIGEDYDFCNRAINAGYKIFCDFRTSLYIGHIGSVTARL